MPFNPSTRRFFRFYLISFFINVFSPLYGQLSVGGSETVSVAAGDTLFTEGLGFAPSSGFDLSGISITKQSSLSHSSLNTSVSQSYLFSPSAPSFSGVLTFSYSDALLNGVPESELQLNYYHINWQAVSTGSLNTTQNILTTAAVSILPSEITLASSLHPLPVEWISLSAFLNNQAAELIWKTAEEDRIVFYEVQHSTNGRDWQLLGKVNPQGNTYNEYHFTDAQVSAGINQYRIRQQDISGNGSFSKIVTVFLTRGKQDMVLYPNPAGRETTTLYLTSPGIISLYQANGSLISRKNYTAGPNPLNLTGLQAGVYLVSNGSQIIRLVIQ